MRAKPTLTKSFGVKTTMEETKQWHKKYEKCQFCTQRRQNISIIT